MKKHKDCLIAILFLLLIVVGNIIYFSLISFFVSQKEESPSPPETLVVVRYATEEEKAQRNREVVEAGAKTVWGEARGCPPQEQAAVMWCILNRVDSSEFPNDILSVIEQPGQFAGYSPDNPVEPHLVALVEDVMGRWELEKTAVGSVGRVLPQDYTFFTGDGVYNHFRDAYKGGNTWDWSLNSPYGEDRGNG